MSKSERTYELEEIIALATARSNRVGCCEVGLDEFGIVDYISMDVGGAKTIRCYELKVSKSDFLSDNKKTFVGDFNYYVLPTELWASVRNFVEKGVGVWLVDKRGKVSCVVQAEKMECPMSRGRVMLKILRALNREHLKHSETAWRERQLAKRVPDISGAPLNIGDSVSYQGAEYEVIALEYQRETTKLDPICVLQAKGTSPSERPEIVKAKSTTVKKQQSAM